MDHPLILIIMGPVITHPVIIGVLTATLIIGVPIGVIGIGTTGTGTTGNPLGPVSHMDQRGTRSVPALPPK